MIKALDRRFGVEIECVIPNEYREHFPMGTYHNGIQLSWAPVGWNCQSDGSIHAPTGHFGAEIVSPPLCGEDGLVQMVLVIDLLERMHAKINKSCGFHIHVDANDLTGEQVGDIAESFRNVETLLFRVNGHLAKQRWDNTYCRRSNEWNGTRYQSLNVTNYFDPSGRAQRTGKRTVEFRLFALSRMDAKKAVAMVYMAVSLVVRTVNDGVMTIGTSQYDGIREYVRSNFTRPECRIVEDGPVWDVVKVLYKDTKRATV